MATILIDDFNSYNDGNLHGQGDWDGNTEFQVQGTTVFKGTKAVEVAHQNAWRIITKIGTARTNSRVTVYIRRSSVSANGNLAFYIRDATADRILVMEEEGAISYYDGSKYNKFGDVSNNTWHYIQIEWRTSDKKARYNLDDGEWTDWATPLSAWGDGGLDRLKLGHYDTESAPKSLFDYIAEYPYGYVPPVTNNAVFFGTNF